MELTELVERVAEIRTKGPTRFARERIQEAAESISRAVVDSRVLFLLMFAPNKIGRAHV